MTTFRILPSAAAVIACAITDPVSAYGDDKQPTATADADFRAGKQLAADGKWQDACVRFEASYRVDPQIGVLLNVADCHEHVGRVATAWAEFRDAEQLALKRSDSRSTYARGRASSLQNKVAKLRVMRPKVLPKGVAVKRDGSDITTQLEGGAAPIDPGDHPLVVSAPGYIDWSTVVHVKPDGATQTIVIPELEHLIDVSPSADPGVEADEPRNRRRRFALGVVAIGAVGIATGVALGVAANSKYHSVADDPTQCDRALVCTPQGAATIRDAHSQTVLADILGTVSLGVIGGGAALWWTSPRDRSRMLTLHPAVSSTGATIAISGRF